jgi:hypothetical protein
MNDNTNPQDIIHNALGEAAWRGCVLGFLLGVATIGVLASIALWVVAR